MKQHRVENAIAIICNSNMEESYGLIIQLTLE